MAHGFVSYSKPNSDLNLSSLIAGKVKDSFGMAAEERKAREKEIAELSNKKELTEEESKRLEFLKEQDSARKQPGLKGFKNSFFAKSLMAQFGGDRKRRLEGTFSKNPRASQDPTLTKEERFSALLDEDSKPAEEPVAPAPVDDLGPMDYGDANAQAPTPQQTTLDKILSKVSSSYDMIGAKLSALQSEEKKSVSKKEETNSRLSRFTKVFKSISDYFDIDNDLKKIEGDIEKEKLNNFKESQADAKASAESDAIKGGEDLSNFEEDLGRPDEKNMVGDLLKSFLNPMNLFKMFRGGGKAGGGKTPGITPTSKAYSAPIGPQPMNSPTPWAAKGAGDRGGMFGSAGFTPRMPAKKLSAGGIVPRKPTKKLSAGGIVPRKPTKKLAAGGIYDNPTTTRLNPGDSVVPLNRNNALADVFKQSGSTAGDKGITGPMGEVLQLPTKVAGGLVLTKMSEVFEGVSSFLKPVITPIMNAVGPAFGLPSTIIAGLFGGAPAAAATLPFNFDAFTGKKASKKSGSSSSTTTPPSTTGGADLGSSMREGETIQAQSNDGPGGFIQGGSGLGSEGGQNTTAGYATHYHLSPPSADEAGFKQARDVAFTAATMMLDRGSSVYFGNIEENANRATLADQIAREQRAHSKEGRTQGGIDMQEKSSTGSMRMKFPLKVTNVTQDINSGSGRTARIIGTNVRLAHGAAGSANSIETATAPRTTGTTPVTLGPDAGARPAARPTTPGAAPQTGSTGAVTLPAVFQTQPKPPPGGVPLSTPMAFSLTNPSPGYTSLYGPLQF